MCVDGDPYALGMARGGAKTSDLVRLWFIEILLIAGAIYSGSRQSGAAVCGTVGTNPSDGMLDCYTGSIAHVVFPWTVGGAVLIGAMTLIFTVIHAVRRR